MMTPSVEVITLACMLCKGQGLDPFDRQPSGKFNWEAYVKLAELQISKRKDLAVLEEAALADCDSEEAVVKSAYERQYADKQSLPEPDQVHKPTYMLMALDGKVVGSKKILPTEPLRHIDHAKKKAAALLIEDFALREATIVILEVKASVWAETKPRVMYADGNTDHGTL